MIHVVLLTCERVEYTARTLETFLGHNPIPDPRLKLWHCDDASQDRRVRCLADEAGFAPLVHTGKRVGVTEMIRRAARKLEHAGAEWMLLLENDWESARALPWAIFEAIQERGDVWALRLYGTHKGRDRTVPAGTRHRGRNGADPKWAEFAVPGWPPEPANRYEVGDIHWGNPPSIAKVAQVAWLHKSAHCEKDAITRSGQIGDHVARVVQNVVYHIGEARTPGFVS